MQLARKSSVLYHVSFKWTDSLHLGVENVQKTSTIFWAIGYMDGSMDKALPDYSKSETILPLSIVR